MLEAVAGPRCRRRTQNDPEPAPPILRWYGSRQSAARTPRWPRGADGRTRRTWGRSSPRWRRPSLLAGRPACPLRRAPRVRTWFELDPDRLLEGDTVAARARTPRRDGPSPQASRSLLVVPPGLDDVDGDEPAAPPPRGAKAASSSISGRSCARWGAYRLGRRGAPQLSDASGSSLRYDARPCTPLKVYPRTAERFGRCSARSRPSFSWGDQPARPAGEGTEFADLRPFVPGDRVRRVNWRATARSRRALGERAPPGAEYGRRPLPRQFAEAHRGDLGMLDLAVRAAAPWPGATSRKRTASASSSFGGVLRWLTRLAASSSSTASSTPARRRDLPQFRLEGDRRSCRRGRCRRTRSCSRLTPLLDERSVARPARPAAPRLRPRGDRDLPSAVRRSSGKGELGRAGLPALVAAGVRRCASSYLQLGVPVCRVARGTSLCRPRWRR